MTAIQKRCFGKEGVKIGNICKNKKKKGGGEVKQGLLFIGGR